MRVYNIFTSEIYQSIFRFIANRFCFEICSHLAFDRRNDLTDSNLSDDDPIPAYAKIRQMRFQFFAIFDVMWISLDS